MGSCVPEKPVEEMDPRERCLYIDALTPPPTCEWGKGSLPWGAATRPLSTIAPPLRSIRSWLTGICISVLHIRCEASLRVLGSRFAGPFILAEVVKGCFCGAPFDLDATPNFKQRIEEAGFSWPPLSPIKYPARDW